MRANLPTGSGVLPCGEGYELALHLPQAPKLPLTQKYSWSIQVAMTLAEYLAQKGVTASDLASKCGVSVSTITRAGRGELWPSRSLMGMIMTHTNGVVTPNDFVGEKAA